MQKSHIKRFSTASIIIASVLSVVFAAISIYGIKDFKELENSTEQYLVCERSALKLQKGSAVLTEQARLYVMTGDAGCMEGYFEEVNVNRNRESAVGIQGSLYKAGAGAGSADNLSGDRQHHRAQADRQSACQL